MAAGAGWLPVRDTGSAKAGVSTRHTLALTNRGGATAAEIARLRDTIQQAVQEKFGLRLEPEPVWVA